MADSSEKNLNWSFQSDNSSDVFASPAKKQVTSTPKPEGKYIAGKGAKSFFCPDDKNRDE